MIHKNRKNVADRFSKIEGHVRGIRNMVEEDRACSDLLIQIAAVRSARDKVAQIILEDHMESMVEAAKSGETQAYISEFKEALSKFF